MGAANLVPLAILFAVVGGIAWVGYQVRAFPLHCIAPAHAPVQIFLYSSELADRGVKKMEKKNVVVTKDGARVGVKEVSAEAYADKTQKAFVKTWNAAQEGCVFTSGSAFPHVTLSWLTFHAQRRPSFALQYADPHGLGEWLVSRGDSRTADRPQLVRTYVTHPSWEARYLRTGNFSNHARPHLAILSSGPQSKFYEKPRSNIK